MTFVCKYRSGRIAVCRSDWECGDGGADRWFGRLGDCLGRNWELYFLAIDCRDVWAGFDGEGFEVEGCCGEGDGCF